MDRPVLIFARAALLISPLPGTAHAEGTVFDATVEMTADDDGAAVGEDTPDERADDPDDGVLDGPAAALDDLEMAGKAHEKRRAKPVELGRHRTPLLPPGEYVAMSIGERRYCLIPPARLDELKDGTPSQASLGRDLCVGIITLLGSTAGAGIGMALVFEGSKFAAIMFPAAGAIALGSVAIVVGVLRCPSRDPFGSAPVGKPISSVIPRPSDIGCGLPCLCPAPGCGCDWGCGCGCGEGASCGCGTCGGGA